ncbi:MAG: nickel pincer cofactor biosynthesis protein LarC [Ignavibacteriae bacterium]|nr:MAG: nickel pincer cofactor biosynthesis protein LarC [Ignavibacteriota bacterium]
MKIAYFDTIAGISGDMTLGALVSAGVSFDELTIELQALGIGGFELQARHIERHGMVATKVDVVISEQPHYHRHLKDIEELIDKSSLTQHVKDRAKKIFREVAVAESKVHNTPIEKIHFHEVGAIDSLVDIVGVSIGLEKLGIQAVYSSPVKVGNGGTVKSQHGVLPVPTPATMEILKGYPILLTDVPFELTTPTGAAIIKALSLGTLSVEKIQISDVGYGAGGRELEQLPNVLRVFIGTLEPNYLADEIVSVETNIDNMNPEIYPYVIEKLISAGANDAYLIPILMKKGRPGIILSALVERANLDKILDIFFRETTTLGVRIQPIERKKLPRGSKQVQTHFGIVSAKVIIVDGQEQLRVEFEECKRIAAEKNLPLGEVYRKLEKELGS